VSTFIHKTGFSIIEKLTGHGVGVRVHEAPHIYNRPHKDMKKVIFKPGMVLAFEPITAITSTDFEHRASSWNLYCKNNDLGAHREYTIVITETGYEMISGITEFLN
jgi:methionyl aminopeptidase